MALYVECIVLFFVVPFLLYPVRHHLAFNVIPILILLATGCWFYLKRQPEFDQRILTRIRGVSGHFLFMAVVFLLLGTATTFLSCIWLPERFLQLPMRSPKGWMGIMVMYPILAALSQEMIFRCFFFHRYQSLFPSGNWLIMANGVSFGLFHLFYANWLAPLLSFFGGLLFAYRYHRSRSLPVVAIEHGLWGNLLFTVGVGWYFYSGSIL